jgi:hypothetical protein
VAAEEEEEVEASITRRLSAASRPVSDPATDTVIILQILPRFEIEPNLPQSPACVCVLSQHLFCVCVCVCVGNTMSSRLALTAPADDGRQGPLLSFIFSFPFFIA